MKKIKQAREIAELFKISPKYKQKRKISTSTLVGDGRRMPPLLRSIYEQGVQAYHLQNYREAATLFIRVLDEGARSSVAAYFLGTSLVRLGDLEDAAPYFERVIDLQQNYEHVMFSHIFLGYLSLRAEKLDKAKKWLKTPLDSDFKNPLMYSFLGYIEHEQENYKRSEDYYREALTLDPKNPSFRNNLGFTFVKRNQDLNTAEALIRSAVKDDRRNARYLHSWGWLFFVKRRFKEALTVLTKAFGIMQHQTIKEDLLEVRKHIKKS